MTLLSRNSADMENIEGNIVRPNQWHKQRKTEVMETKNLDEEIRAEILTAVESAIDGKIDKTLALDSISTLLKVYKT